MGGRVLYEQELKRKVAIGKTWKYRLINLLLQFMGVRKYVVKEGGKGGELFYREMSKLVND